LDLKPPPFEYFAPQTLEEALSLLAEHGEDAKVLAGGQSLVPLLALRLARPSALIDLGRVPGMDQIRRDDGHVVVGAMARERAAERSGVVASGIPLLAEALPLIGHVAIRNRGTIGGSAAHADPAAEIPAVAVALEAEIVAASAAKGERTIPATDFFQGFFTTALEPDEVLTEVRFPVMPAGTGVAFEEAARRHGDFAMVGAAVVVRLEGAKLSDVRLALTGVSDTPLRCRAAEQTLIGSDCTPEAVDQAIAEATASLTPPSDLHGTSNYRRHLAGVLLRRAIARAASKSGVTI
jgi:carbon-monoxide dehydrogenase medium subunit